jgi:16S rRNA (guanine(527)-N(7))-methyltransferase RsmG
MDMNTSKKVAFILESCCIVHSPGLMEKVCHYLALLEQWNRKINLTSTLNQEELIRLHFAESFFGATLILPEDGPVLDVGSGAGFPGMAMKLIFPEKPFYLVESRQKKAAFLSTVRRELKLSLVTILNHPLRQCLPEMFPVQPGVLTWRAVGNPAQIAREARRLLRPEASILLFTTESQSETLCNDLQEIDWISRIPLPWSREKILLKGLWSRRNPVE